MLLALRGNRTARRTEMGKMAFADEAQAFIGLVQGVLARTLAAAAKFPAKRL